MPTYASLVDLKNQSLDQFLNDPAPPDAALTARLDQAQAMVDAYLGADASLTLAAAGTRVVYGTGTIYLPLPAHTAGSVTLVSVPSGYTVPTYIQQDGALVITESTGVIAQPAYGGLWATSYTYNAYWQPGLAYTVSAAFGYDASTLAILKAVTLDLAVQLWRYKDSGGSETIGAEGGITTVRSGLTMLHKLSLDAVKRRISQSAGVY